MGLLKRLIRVGERLATIAQASPRQAGECRRGVSRGGKGLLGRSHRAISFTCLDQYRQCVPTTAGITRWRVGAVKALNTTLEVRHAAVRFERRADREDPVGVERALVSTRVEHSE